MSNDYAPKVFDRANPCTKIDIWNCFHVGGQFVTRRVIDARVVIGLNTPKYLLREGFMLQFQRGDNDACALTKVGEDWLTKGLLRFIQMHPERAGECMDTPPGYVRQARHAQAAQAPAQASPAPPRGRAIIRRSRK